MDSTRHEYWLPTYGVEYPATKGVSKGALPSQLFRPVEYQSTQKLLDIRAERSKLDGRREAGVLQQQQEEEEEEDKTDKQGTPSSSANVLPVPLNWTEIRVTVQNRTLWKSFLKIGNEMIVTKPGRCLFPTLIVSLRGLHPKKQYTVGLRMSPVDNYRYKYNNSAWIKVGESDIVQNKDRQIFMHPCSPTTGQFWTKRPISFKSVKITHYPNSKHGNILLHTMHKYIMAIVITSTDNLQSITVPLPVTIFIAVSAYQNSDVIKLKIDNNPFAKAFKYQDKSAIMEHFALAENCKPHKQVTPPPVLNQPGPLPFLSVFTNTTKSPSDSSLSGSPILSTPTTIMPGTPTTIMPGTPTTILPGTPTTIMPGMPATRPGPGMQFTALPQLLPAKTLSSTTAATTAVPLVQLPLLQAPPLPPVQGSLLPLAPLVSPYMLLMLCNQLKTQNLVNAQPVTVTELGENGTERSLLTE